jgi:hypothetical protein
MLRFLRRLVGLVLLVLGVFFLLNQGLAAYASLLADPVPAAVTRPCEVISWAGLDVQSRCAGSWTPAGGTPETGQVYGAGDPAAGGTVQVTPAGRYALVVPAGTDRTLGLASAAVLLLGLSLLFGGRRHRRRPTVRARRRYAGKSGYYDRSDPDWDDSDSRSGSGDPHSSSGWGEAHSSSGWGDSGGDSGGGGGGGD